MRRNNHVFDVWLILVVLFSALLGWEFSYFYSFESFINTWINVLTSLKDCFMEPTSCYGKSSDYEEKIACYTYIEKYNEK